MFRNRIMDLLSRDGQNYSLDHFRHRLQCYHDEFLNETGKQLTNKNLRKYVGKMIGKGLSSNKDNEVNFYSLDRETTTDDDLNRIKQNQLDILFPNDFDFDELED